MPRWLILLSWGLLVMKKPLLQGVGFVVSRALIQDKKIN